MKRLEMNVNKCLLCPYIRIFDTHFACHDRGHVIEDPQGIDKRCKLPESDVAGWDGK